MKTVWCVAAVALGLAISPVAGAQERAPEPVDGGPAAALDSARDSAFDGGSEATVAPAEAESEPADAGTPAVAGSVDAGLAPSAPDAPVAEAAPALLPSAEPAGIDARSPSETIVVGTPEAQTSGSVHVVKAKTLQRFEQDDPHAILRSVPGVYARGEDGFGLRPNLGLRGANSDRSKKVTLLEDGVLFAPAPYSAPAAYYFPLVTRMQAVRVLKGPAAVVHGPQTVGGSVEFITRDIPFGEGFGADLAGGAYAYGKAHTYYGASTERSGFLVEGVHLRSGGFKELDFSDASTGFARNEWMVKARHRLELPGSARHTFQLKLGYSDEGSNETYLGLADADFRASPQRRYLGSALDRMAWARTQLVASHSLALGGLTLDTTAYRQDFDRTWRKANRFGGAALSDVLAAPTESSNAIYYAVLTGAQDSSTPEDLLFIGPNQRTFVSQGLQSVARWSASTGPVQHELEAGARYHFDSIERRHTEDGYAVREGALLLETPTQTTVSNHESTHAVAFHVMDAITWGSWALTPGLRTELIRSRSRERLDGTLEEGAVEVLLPGVGLHRMLSSQLGAFAGVHRGFSPPAPGQAEAVAAESSLNYEAGARWIRRGERLELVGYFNDYSNLTDICTVSNGCLDQNLDRQFSAGSAHIYGLEALAEKTFRPGAGFAFPLSVTYTLTCTRLLDAYRSEDPQLGEVTPGDELPYVPRHQLFASAGIEKGRFGVFAGATFVGAMWEAAGTGIPLAGLRTDPLWTVDASSSWAFSREARIYVTAQNVFDRQAIVSRRPFGARPNAPRIVQLGFKYER